MATKKTEKTATKATSKKAAAAPKAPKTAKAPKAAAGPRHPRAKLAAAHGTKADLAKALASSVAREGQDAADVEAKLKTASNAQLLRLSKAVDAVKAKWGDRGKLIAAIGTAQNKSKDKDYLAKLDSYSLPQLLDLANANERRARS
ncbi:MAG: hypothetical protein JNL83_27890 [Myxococcales bacterium]|nr:hypothetical protein [Myxococcales bacterium]